MEVHVIQFKPTQTLASYVDEKYFTTPQHHTTNTVEINSLQFSDSKKEAPSWWFVPVAVSPTSLTMQTSRMHHFNH